MANLALDTDTDMLAEEPLQPFDDTAAGGGISALDDRCRVLPDQPLPHLTTGHARAFMAVDVKDPSQQLYALIVEPQLPFRLEVMSEARDLREVSVVQPVHWGSIDWPQSNRRETMLLLQRPPGMPLMATIETEIQPWPVDEIIECLIAPMALLLSTLDHHGLAHRNIRPTNLFREAGECAVHAGEFYSVPAGYSQPAVFEPIERAMCPPAGRGRGDIADDLFALGVTALFLAVGRNPVAHLDETTLLAKRAELGSYAALTSKYKPPSELAAALRSLLQDHRRERWTLEDVTSWVETGVAVQASQPTAPRATRGFEFCDGQYHTRRELALALGQNWEAARKEVQDEMIERWAERSLKDRVLTSEIVACRQSSSEGPRTISDELLLARTIVTLDPEGPLRFGNLAVMPDGLAGLAAAALGDENLTAIFTGLVKSRLMEFWRVKQQRLSQTGATAYGDAKRMTGYLEKSGPGFGIERCAYEFNKGMVCQSPRFRNVNAVHIREMIEAIDATAKKGEQPLDLHVAAFLGARFTGSIDKELKKFANARGGEEALLAQLAIFAAAQHKHGPEKLPNMARLFADHLDTLLSPYHNVALRERLHGAAKSAADAGKLSQFLRVIRDGKAMNADRRGFEAAKRQYRELGRRIVMQQKARERMGLRSQSAGRKVAAVVSIGIALVAVAMVTLGALQ